MARVNAYKYVEKKGAYDNTNSMSMNIVKFYTIIIEPNYELVHLWSTQARKKTCRSDIRTMRECELGKPVW